jgi:hypothetical protein
MKLVFCSDTPPPQTQTQAQAQTQTQVQVQVQASSPPSDQNIQEEHSRPIVTTNSHGPSASTGSMPFFRAVFPLRTNAPQVVNNDHGEQVTRTDTFAQPRSRVMECEIR